MMRISVMAAGIALGVAIAGPAFADLSLLKSFTGHYDVSTDGCGSVTQSCLLTANAPAGAVVEAAYLYTSTFDFATPSSLGGGYTNLGLTGGAFGLEAGRVDITGIVSSVINGGPGGAYNFNYTESSPKQDGGALVVVYSKAGLPTTTVSIFDGFSDGTGTMTMPFADPLTPSAVGFRAEMRLGIGYGFNGADPNNPSLNIPNSTITVNGNLLTSFAGHCDDAVDSSCENGNLITVGDDADPFSAILPTLGGDHEKYDFRSLINDGDTQVVIETTTPIADNLFLAVFAVSGGEQVTTPTPEPVSMALLGSGLVGLGLLRRHRR